MRNSHWFRRLEVALEFDSGFEIFLLLGRGELARPALARIAEELRRFGAPHWHHLHLDGLDALLAEDQPEGVLHLVHGFERMHESPAASLAARLNVNRDRLQVLRGPVIFWIPEHFYEELLRQAPDFVAWRSQATVVSDADLDVAQEVLAEEFLLCHAQRAAALTLRDVPPLDVLESGARRPLLDWLEEGTTRSLCYDAKQSSLSAISWCAGQLARQRDAGDYDKIPVLLPSLLLALAETTDARDELALGIARLWQAGVLHIMVAAAITNSERDGVVARAGDNRVLVAVLDEDSECVSIAPLSDQQAHLVVDGVLSDVTPQERDSWHRTMTETIQWFGDRVRPLGVFTAVVWWWRVKGLRTVTRGLSKRGWREESIRDSEVWYLDLPPYQHSVPLTAALDVLVRPDVLALAQSLFEFGTHRSGGWEGSLLAASISLFRADGQSIPCVGLVEALVRFGPEYAFGGQGGVSAWAETVSLARKVEPLNPALLVKALDRLGVAQHLDGQDEEAKQTVQEALSLANDSGQSPELIGQLWSTLGYVLYRQDRLVEALETAERGLFALEGALSDEADVHRHGLLLLCDDACSRLGLQDRALAFAARAVESRHAPSGARTELAERLLHAGKLERALATVSEAIGQLAVEDTQPRKGQVSAFVVLAAIQRAMGDHEKAFGAMQEAVRICRMMIEDDDRGGANGLAQNLLVLSSDLEQFDRAEVLIHLLEAVDIFEQLAAPGQYPDDLAAALTRLGDYASARKMYPLATAAYARILALAAPFPARTSEPVLEIERRLVALCKESGVPLDDALARGQRPVTVEA